MKPKLGFIGIGLMGEAMTRRLLDRGYAVTVWNLEPERLDTVVAFGAVNLLVGLVVLAVAAEHGGAVVGVGAVILALIAFGGGACLIALRRPWTKGLGIGLMIGWALLSITSVGFCTGLNPEMYTGGI